MCSTLLQLMVGFGIVNFSLGKVDNDNIKTLMNTKFKPRPEDMHSRFLHPEEITGRLRTSAPLFNQQITFNTKQPLIPFSPTSITQIENAKVIAMPGQKYGRQLRTVESMPIIPFISILPSLMSISSGATSQNMWKIETNVRANDAQDLNTKERKETNKSIDDRFKNHTQPTDVAPLIIAHPRYKLIYFDARGICESIRLMFHYANESFVDERLSKNSWLRYRDQTFFGRLPILEVDGKKLGQCYSISRYLARKFGLIGTDEWDQAKLDEVFEFHRSVTTDVSPYLFVLGGYKNGNKDFLRTEVFLPAAERYFPMYVDLLKQSPSGFFGKSVSWVDFAISEFFTTINKYEPIILQKYPAILKFVTKICQLPQIRDYIQKRSQTPL